MTKGKIIQIIGSVVDVEFTGGKLPEIFNALTVAGPNGEVTLEQILKEKENGEISKRAIKQDVIRGYFNKIKESEAILVLNFDKKGIKNYIGGNTFLEMGFAYVLNKKLFLLNEIPDMPYKDEIKVMQPIIINGDLSKIS